MYTLFNYLYTVWTVLILNCIQPVNWKYCMKDQHIWLYPEIQRGVQLYLNPSSIYQEERDYLNTK